MKLILLFILVINLGCSHVGIDKPIKPNIEVRNDRPIEQTTRPRKEEKAVIFGLLMEF